MGNKGMGMSTTSNNIIIQTYNHAKSRIATPPSEARNDTLSCHIQSCKHANTQIYNPIIKILFIICFYIIFSIPAFAGNPQIISMTMQPPAPNFGDRITVTITYCGQLYNDHELGVVVSTVSVPSDARISGNGQVFIISRAGMNVHTSVPAASPGAEIGYTANPAPGAGAPQNCQTCGSGSNDGTLLTKVYGDDEVLTVPDADFFPGCNPTNLYLHAVFKDNNLNDGEYQSQAACQIKSVSWTIPTLPATLSIHKSMQGVLQYQNDLLLISVDYNYANGQPQIRETVPNTPGGGSSWTLVSAGPQGFYSGPALGSAVTPGQGLTWNLPNRTGVKGSATGTVWFLLRVTGANPGTDVRVDNTANASMGALTDSSSASIIVGRPAITITKSQSSASPMYGDNLTYYLEYQINGSQLVAYQPFDDISLGGYSSSPPTGWQFRPSVSNGSWVIEDPCGTGDRIIRGDTTSSDDYPGLLYSGYPMTTDTECYGIIQSEVLINPSGETQGNGYEGADSLVIIRDDGLGTGGRAYGLVLSIDDFIGTNATGNIGFQRCGGTPYGPYTSGTCMWPTSVNTIAITGNKWYKVKVQTGPGDPCAFSAKVWIKGDPEPSGWTITWTDANCTADGFNCSGSGRTWYSGVAEQGGAGAYTQDSYNNFIILKPRVSANTELYDTIPTGIGYVGQQGPKSMNITPGSMIGWGLGSISDEGGSFTWWGKVNTCDPITNIGAIDGNDPIIPVISNDVVAVPICPEITGITKTANVGTVSLGATVTFTISYCNNGPGTISNYRIWDTVPSGMTYAGCSGGTGCSLGSGMVTWTVGNIVPGVCGSVTYWARATSAPYNPFMKYREIFAHYGAPYTMKVYDPLDFYKYYKDD